MSRAKHFIAVLLLGACAWLPALAEAAAAPMAFIESQIAAHPNETGAYVLDTGREALLARAWLADHAERSIEVQYFIWSADNLGILASEALLRAAERGVKVRVIVDDLLIDAPDKSLLRWPITPTSRSAFTTRGIRWARPCTSASSTS